MPRNVLLEEHTAVPVQVFVSTPVKNDWSALPHREPSLSLKYVSVIYAEYGQLTDMLLEL